MSAVNEIIIRAAVAAVNKDSHIRVYETDVHGAIREAQYEGSWTGGTSNNIIATGKIGTPVAATSLGLDNIRVYYIGMDNKLKEAAYDAGKGWYDGDLSKAGFDVAPYSGVSAVYLGGQSRIRVYGQKSDNTIQEWVFDNNGKGWVVGSNLGPALPGSRIAATSWGTSSIHIRVYLQDKNLNIFEKAWDGSWYTGGLNFSNPVTQASLGVTSWGDGSSLGIRVYYAAPGNVMKEKGLDGSGGWYDGGFSQPAIPASNVCAIPLNVLRVYLQNGTQDSAVTEIAWINGRWVIGNPALPPA